MTKPLSITLACGNYDRTRPLIDGRVAVEGADVDFLLGGVDPMLASAARKGFDVVERSLSTIVMQHGPDTRYVPLPIFPSRAFRHNGVYVRADSEVEVPAQMRGWKIGISGYTVTGLVWIRGMLADHYDLPVDSVTYVNGGLDIPGAPTLWEAEPPRRVSIEEAPADTTLSRMLLAGEIDAIYALHAPRLFHEPSSGIRRLFSDVRTEERKYFEMTGFFPLMHVLAVRRAVLDPNPWLAVSLAAAFTAGKQITLAEMTDTRALHTMLPWGYTDLEEAEQLMGPAFWADGVDTNLANLMTFIRYAYEQGLIAEPFDPRGLFPGE